MVPSGKRRDLRKRDRSAEPWRSSYGTTAYREARQVAIARTHGRCSICGRQVAHMAGDRWVMDGGEVHHMRALCDDGDDSPANLMLLCAKCHRKVDSQRRG